MYPYVITETSKSGIHEWNSIMQEIPNLVEKKQV